MQNIYPIIPCKCSFSVRKTPLLRQIDAASSTHGCYIRDR